MLFEKNTEDELNLVTENLTNFAKALVDFFAKVKEFFDEITKLFAAEK